MSFSEGLDPILKCPICVNIYDNDHYIPLIIPCKENHTICSQCLASLLAKPGKFHCPLDGTTPMNSKGKDKVEFELNTAFIEAIEDNCHDHPARKLDLVCIKCRCKICLACEKKGNHQGHETLLREEYEKKFLIKFEENQEKFLKVQEMQLSKQTILQSKKGELLQNIESLFGQYIDKIKNKKAKMEEEIAKFFQEIKQDEEVGFPANNPQTPTYLKWKNEMEEKLTKIKENNPFSEAAIIFTEEEKLLATGDLDKWLKQSKESLYRFERDLEEISVRLKIELETTLDEFDVLQLKIDSGVNSKKDLQQIEILTKDYSNEDQSSPTLLSNHRLRYREKEMKKAFEYVKDFLAGNTAIQEEIVRGTGLTLKADEAAGIQGLSNLTQEHKKLKVWTKHIKSLTLSCATVQDEDISTLKRVLESLNSLAAINIDFSENSKLTETGCEILSEGISQLSQLTQLQLKFCLVPHLRGPSFEKIFTAFPQIVGITHINLNFSGCKDISDQTLMNLASNLQHLINLQHIVLDFRDVNNITDSGVSGLAKSLPRLSKLKLLDLNFSGSSKITDKGLIDLTQALYHLNELDTMNLNFDGIIGISDNGLDEVGWAFSHLMQLSQISLSFIRANITTRGVEELVKTIEHLSNLKVLKLNFIRTSASEKCLEQIGSTLSTLNSIDNITLNFNWKTLTESSFDTFVEVLAGLKDLANLELEFGEIMATKKAALREKLQTKLSGVSINF